MGGKKTGKGKGAGKKKGGARHGQGGGNAKGGNDYRGSTLSGPTQGSGTQNNNFLHTYAPVPTALASLPVVPPEFTGRDEDVEFLLRVLDPDPAAQDSGPAVAVLSGWGGVGKTTLVHVAGHRATERDWFTGVLLVNLRGYDPHPATAEDVLEALLRSMGVQPQHIPPTLMERETLYRSQLTARQNDGERFLVVADNASSVEQVRPLLPPGHHALLVTSRRSLPGLGRMRTVNLLQPEEAVALLGAALRKNDPDDRRIEEDPQAAQQVAVACGCLPLALQITAALLASDPDQPLAERAERLASAGRLEGINDGERSLRATFDQSLEHLPPQQAELFRLLSLNAGPDISTAAAVVLTAQPEATTEHLLGQLAAAHLIERGTVRGRWQMHDLLREYALHQANAQSDRSRPSRRRFDQARSRLTDYYVHTTEAANIHLQPPGRAVVAPLFLDHRAALVWLDAERENLIATAHAEGTTHATSRLGFGLGRYLEQRRRLQDLITLRALALDACKAHGDSVNLPAAWNNLGSALGELHRYAEAITAHETARTLCRETGDRNGEAGAWNNLGNALRELHRYDEAITAHETARTLHQETADRNGEAGAWNNLGNTLRELHRYDEAITAAETARTLHQEAGDRHGEAIAWNNLGTALRGVEQYEQAVEAGSRAAELLTEANDLFRAGEAYGELAVTLTAAGADLGRVSQAWSQSADAYTRAGAAEEAEASRTNAAHPPPYEP